jgi:DNA-binding transcriptional LysR family regulator
VDTRHLLTALAVEEHGSFTAAAVQLGLSQPTLSRHVATLENELGFQLFHRGPRKVRPTKNGRRFLTEARRVLIAVENAEAAARDGADPDARLHGVWHPPPRRDG